MTSLKLNKKIGVEVVDGGEVGVASGGERGVEKLHRKNKIPPPLFFFGWGERKKGAEESCVLLEQNVAEVSFCSHTSACLSTSLLVFDPVCCFVLSRASSKKVIRVLEKAICEKFLSEKRASELECELNGKSVEAYKAIIFPPFDNDSQKENSLQKIILKIVWKGRGRGGLQLLIREDGDGKGKFVHALSKIYINWNGELSSETNKK